MAHTYDTGVTSAKSNGDPKTFNHTCGAGATVLTLMLVIGGGTARTGGAPTYNSVAMTQADAARQAASSPETTVEMWYLLDPPTGSAYAISIPNTGAVYITARTASFKAAAGSKTRLLSADYATGTSTNPTGPTHTGLRFGDVQVAVLGYGDDSASATSSGTSLYRTDEGTYVSASQYSIFATGNAFLMWTDATSEDWAIVSAVFTEYADVAADTVNVSKAIGYAVVMPPDGVNVSKAVGYAVLSPPSGVNVSKVVAYAVLAPPAVVEAAPLIFIF